MARPKKRGLDYFPFDIDFFTNTKISRLRAMHGSVGVMVYIVLLCKIYDNGYYIDLDDDLILDVSDMTKTEPDTVKKAVDFLLEKGLFDGTLAEKFSILTSETVQQRFQFIKSHNRSAEIYVNKNYWLLTPPDTKNIIRLEKLNINAEETPVYSEETAVNSVENSPKESKEKKTKENESTGKEKKEEESCACAGADISPSPHSGQNSQNAREVFSAYNRICVSLPPVTAYTDSRVRAVGELLKKGFSTEDFERLFRTAEGSAFLKGHNTRSWKAGFDWLISDANIGKVLDGAYADPSPHLSPHGCTVSDAPCGFGIDDINSLINNFDAT